MPYDPNTHHRRSIRLPGYDYAASGAYFVTICVYRGEMILGEVRDGVMVMNSWGRLVDDFWAEVVGHFEDVAVDCHVTMPNHVHAVIVLVDRGRRAPGGVAPGGGTPPLRDAREPRRGEVSSPTSAASPTSAPSPLATLANVVAYYKYQTTKQINILRDMSGVRFWQRNYWEHVIRDETDLTRIREYIPANPARWADDRLYPSATM